MTKEMKKFKLNILALGAVIIGTTSCSESFLDTEPITSTTTGNFYKTENDAYRALVGCYDGWQTTASDGFQFYLASEILSDECLGATGQTDGYAYQVMDRFDISISPSDINILEPNWKLYYAGIYRCNEFLKYEEQIDWKTENRRETYIGECRALRALMYFDMVRMWENIPLVDEPTTENLPQSHPDLVYALIVEDLKYAINNIPANAYPKANAATNDGHITKYAAEALLARVYLFYTGYYGKDLAGVSKAEVLEGLEDVIANSGCSLVPEFKNLWPAACSTPIDGELAFNTTYAGEGNSEIVLAQKFNNTSDYSGNADSNIWMRMIGMRSLSASPYGRGWGACTVNPKIVNAYENGDTRKAASIIDLDAEGITATADFQASVKDWREYTGYTIKKYSPLAFYNGNSATKEDGSGDFQMHNHQDYFVVRLSDVYLMAAELGSAKALEYVNRVRERAYTVSVSNGVPVLADGYTSLTSVSKEIIMKERMLELSFEGHRYWDLLRQGVDYAASQIAGSISVLNGNNPATVTIDANNIIVKRGLMPIPQNQITLSGNVLVQNDGWR